MLEIVDKETFDQYILSEPDTNLYQTPAYQEYIGNNPVYLAYKKGEFYCGFAAVNFVKESLFKKAAICEFGYMTNVYDFDVLDEFQKEVISFLKEKRISKFIISPNIPYITKYGNNDRIIEKFKSYGYKAEEKNIYTLDIGRKKKELRSDASIYISLDGDTAGFGTDFSKEKSFFKDNFHTLVSGIDYEKTVEALKEDEEKLNTIVQLKETLKNDMSCECISFVQYNNVLYVFNYHSRTDSINTTPLLIRALYDYGRENHCTRIVSLKNIDSFQPTQLLGKFTLTI